MQGSDKLRQIHFLQEHKILGVFSLEKRNDCVIEVQKSER